MPPVLDVPKAEAAAPLPKAVSVDDLITEAADRYGVSRDHLYATLSCESEGFKDVAIQSEWPDKNGPNGRENSWGIAQIWLDPQGHPEVSREEAQDPAFAADFAAKLFATGGEHQFHCYDLMAARGWK